MTQSEPINCAARVQRVELHFSPEQQDHIAETVEAVMNLLLPGDDRTWTFEHRHGEQREHRPRKPTLASVSKQARTAGIPVARHEVKPDRTVIVVTGKPETTESENPWPLDEFRAKETKQ